MIIILSSSLPHSPLYTAPPAALPLRLLPPERLLIENELPLLSGALGLLPISPPPPPPPGPLTLPDLVNTDVNVLCTFLIAWSRRPGGAALTPKSLTDVPVQRPRGERPET